jgi:hypothetical protein
MLAVFCSHPLSRANDNRQTLLSEYETPQSQVTAMTYVAAISAAALAMLSTQALAQTQNYPVGGFGDAWAQDQPSSIGIDNGYDPSTETYIIPHSAGRRTTAMPSRYQSRTRSGMEP